MWGRLVAVAGVDQRRIGDGIGVLADDILFRIGVGVIMTAVDVDRLEGHLPEGRSVRPELVAAVHVLGPTRHQRIPSTNSTDPQRTDPDINQIAVLGVNARLQIVARERVQNVVALGAERPVVADNEIVIRDMMFLSLSLDHRIVDGATGARFLNHMMKYLENPGLFLLEL